MTHEVIVTLSSSVVTGSSRSSSPLWSTSTSVRRAIAQKSTKSVRRRTQHPTDQYPVSTTTSTRISLITSSTSSQEQQRTSWGHSGGKATTRSNDDCVVEAFGSNARCMSVPATLTTSSQSEVTTHLLEHGPLQGSITAESHNTLSKLRSTTANTSNESNATKHNKPSKTIGSLSDPTTLSTVTTTIEPLKSQQSTKPSDRDPKSLSTDSSSTHPLIHSKVRSTKSSKITSHSHSVSSIPSSTTAPKPLTSQSGFLRSLVPPVSTSLRADQTHNHLPTSTASSSSIRSTAPTSATSHIAGNNNRTAEILGGSIGGLALTTFLVALVIFLIRRRNEKRERQNRQQVPRIPTPAFGPAFTFSAPPLSTSHSSQPSAATSSTLVTNPSTLDAKPSILPVIPETDHPAYRNQNPEGISSGSNNDSLNNPVQSNNRLHVPPPLTRSSSNYSGISDSNVSFDSQGRRRRSDAFDLE